jgi:hypothetical protein
MTAADALLAAMRDSLDRFRGDMAKAGFYVGAHLPRWSTACRLAAAREAINRT